MKIEIDKRSGEDLIKILEAYLKDSEGNPYRNTKTAKMLLKEMKLQLCLSCHKEENLLA